MLVLCCILGNKAGTHIGRGAMSTFPAPVCTALLLFHNGIHGCSPAIQGTYCEQRRTLFFHGLRSVLKWHNSQKQWGFIYISVFFRCVKFQTIVFWHNLVSIPRTITPYCFSILYTMVWNLTHWKKTELWNPHYFWEFSHWWCEGVQWTFSHSTSMFDQLCSEIRAWYCLTTTASAGVFHS